jgi:hypothetical protein
MLTAEAIVFAINSSIKLGRSLQSAYAASIRSRRLVLPLPNFDAKPPELIMRQFFETDGKRFLDELERLKTLHEKANSGTLDEKELEEYRHYYLTYFYALHQSSSSFQVTPQEVTALLTVRQWEAGRTPRSKALQLVAGLLVEIGVDYFHFVPGALNPESPQGVILKRFLAGLEDIDISQADDFSQAITQRLLPRLFTAAVEVVSELPAEITNDPKLQHFIQNTSRQVAVDLLDRLRKVDTLEAEEEQTRWGQVIVGSLLRHAGREALSSASDLFGASDAETKLIQQTGASFLAMILDEKSGRLRIRDAFNAENLDELVRVSMGVLAEHPELLTRQEGLREIVSGLGAALSTQGINRPSLLPELARLVLEKTAGNLHLLWRVEEDRAEHLLVVAAKEVLECLSAPAGKGAWRPKLSNIQLLDLMHVLIDEIVENPAWIEQKLGERSLAGEALHITLRCIGDTPRAQRLHPRTLEQVLRLNLRAVAASPRLLAPLKLSNETAASPMLGKAMELIFDAVFAKDETPLIHLPELLQEIMDFAFDELLERNPDAKGLIALKMALSPHSGFNLLNGFDRDWAGELAQAVLGVLEAHPALVSNDRIVQDLLGELAATLRASKINRPGLLPQLARVCLRHAGENLDVILHSKTNEARHTLTHIAGQALSALAAADTHGLSPFALTEAHIIDIIEMILEEAVENLQWTNEAPLVRKLLEAVLDATNNLSSEIPTSYILFRVFVAEALEACREQALLLEAPPAGAGSSTLDMALEVLTQTILENVADDKHVRWALSQHAIMGGLLRAYLAFIARRRASKEAIDEAETKVAEALKTLRGGALGAASELLEAIQEKLGS